MANQMYSNNTQRMGVKLFDMQVEVSMLRKEMRVKKALVKRTQASIDKKQSVLDVKVAAKIAKHREVALAKKREYSNFQ